MVDISKKDYLLHNDREAYSALLLEEIKQPESDAARLKAVDDYVKANKGKDEKIAALSATLRELPLQDRQKLAADAKQEVAKTVVGQQKVAHRREFEEKEAKEGFDFNIQKYSDLYAALTGKAPDMDKLVVKAAAQMVYKPEEQAKAAEDIRKNLAAMDKTDAYAPKHMIASSSAEKAEADLVGILASYESQKRGRAREDVDTKEYIAYLSERQKAVADITAAAVENKQDKTLSAAIANKIKGNAR